MIEERLGKLEPTTRGRLGESSNCKYYQRGKQATGKQERRPQKKMQKKGGFTEYRINNPGK